MLAQLDRDAFGEVNNETFVAEFYACNQQKSDEKQLNKYFTKNQERFEAVAKAIVERKMKDFGTFLKGNDFDKTGLITQTRAFQVLQSLFAGLLGEGDIFAMLAECEAKGEVDISIL
jgi:hypothetical protein